MNPSIHTNRQLGKAKSLKEFLSDEALYNAIVEYPEDALEESYRLFATLLVKELPENRQKMIAEGRIGDPRTALEVLHEMRTQSNDITFFDLHTFLSTPLFVYQDIKQAEIEEDALAYITDWVAGYIAYGEILDTTEENYQWLEKVKQTSFSEESDHLIKQIEREMIDVTNEADDWAEDYLQFIHEERPVPNTEQLTKLLDEMADYYESHDQSLPSFHHYSFDTPRGFETTHEIWSRNDQTSRLFPEVERIDTEYTSSFLHDAEPKGFVPSSNMEEFVQYGEENVEEDIIVDEFDDIEVASLSEVIESLPADECVDDYPQMDPFAYNDDYLNDLEQSLNQLDTSYDDQWTM